MGLGGSGALQLSDHCKIVHLYVLTQFFRPFPIKAFDSWVSSCQENNFVTFYKSKKTLNLW